LPLPACIYKTILSSFMIPLILLLRHPKAIRSLGIRFLFQLFQ
jgi:hypothetical protein